MLRYGDVLEAAIWADGTETAEIMDRFMADMRGSLAELAGDEGVVIGPVTLTVKRPRDDKVPSVPDHIQGPDVRLLVYEAGVVCAMPRIVEATSFVADLDRKDLMRLRAITRQAAPRPLSDRECDEIIEAIGPASAVKSLRETTH